jgi:hypothetical protein
MTACNYCLSGCSDDGHSLDDEGHGLSRECFHVNLGDLDEGKHLGMLENDPGPASRVDIPRELAVVPVPAGVRKHSSSKSARCRPSSTRKQGDLRSSGKTSSRSGQASHSPEKRVIGPGMSNAVSLTMSGQRYPRPSARPAKTWLQQRCCSERCRSHPPPRGGISRASSRISWSMPRSDKPKALPPEGEGAPRSFAQHPPDTCGRPRSAPSAHGTGRLRPRIASATSNTVATIEPASMIGCAEATTPGAEDATTVGRIGALRPNRQVCKPSAGPYDGRAFLARFRAPTTITKYSRETRPELWLADYRLACQLGGTDDDNLIICNHPLFLSDAARAWLEHLPPAQISNWDDLVKAFARNFQGTYVCPGNSWDLRSCRQQPGESLRGYIRWFSKQRTELPNITDSDVIGAFLAGTTCRDLVSKLGRKTPTKACELMDIATKFASGQETVEAIFWKDKQP